MEQKFWDLLVPGDYGGVGNLLSPDFISVTNKVRDRAAFLDDIQANTDDCSISPVLVNHPQVKLVSPDVATIAYSEVIASACKNREIKINSTTITVWVRRDHVWRMHLRSQLFANGFAVQGN